MCDSSVLISIPVVFSFLYMYLHVIPFVNYTVFLWGYLDSLQFSSYYKYCYFKPLSVSVHMCKSFCIEYYISTSEMCNLIQRGYQLVFKSSCIRLHNYSMSLPAHKFFFKCSKCRWKMLSNELWINRGTLGLLENHPIILAPIRNSAQ